MQVTVCRSGCRCRLVSRRIRLGPRVQARTTAPARHTSSRTRPPLSTRNGRSHTRKLAQRTRNRRQKGALCVQSVEGLSTCVASILSSRICSRRAFGACRIRTATAGHKSCIDLFSPNIKAPEALEDPSGSPRTDRYVMLRPLLSSTLDANIPSRMLRHIRFHLKSPTPSLGGVSAI